MKSVFFFVLLASANLCSADTLTLPQDLMAYAAENNCAAIPNFLDRPGEVEPPYAYGVVPGEVEDSAVMWCASNKNNPKPYLLLFMVKDTVTLGCPKAVSWASYPGGLSVKKDLKLGLADFRYLDSPNKKGPSGENTSGNVIVSYYDGITSYFYCYKGSWLSYTTD